MKCVRTLVSGCVFSVGTGIVCLFLVSADVIYGIVRAASHKERQLPCQTRLLLPCPAPGRHPASPSHFNYGWHCLKTRRGRGHTRVFIEKPTHTHYLKRFYGAETFPRGGEDLFARRAHGASGKKIPDADEAFKHLICLRRLTKGASFSHAAAAL